MDSRVDTPQMRLVDRVVLHGDPVPFSRLLRRVVTPKTRFLVMDLDRTVHLGRNMGELLGWELVALSSYGPEELARMEANRKSGRLIFDPTRPIGSMRYLWVGARTWAAPGLYYLFFGKIPARYDRLSRWAHRAFGPDPVRQVQRVPQKTLLGLLKGVPKETLKALAQRVWERHAGEQVISREDLDELRERVPGLKIVISSASPQVVVEVARERLGADLAEGSEPGRIQSGPAKIARLAERFPEIRDPSVETVGITDTGYGEDHCWAEHFTRVVDINSDSPFPPLVTASSPLLEVHSAQVLTPQESELQMQGDPGWADPRRELGAKPHVYEREELDTLLSDLLTRAEELALDKKAHAFELSRLRREARQRLGTRLHEGSGREPSGAAVTAH